jgi:hypothetical protein
MDRWLNLIFVAAVIFIFLYVVWHGIKIQIGDQIHIELYGLSKYQLKE